MMMLPDIPRWACFWIGFATHALFILPLAKALAIRHQNELDKARAEGKAQVKREAQT